MSITEKGTKFNLVQGKATIKVRRKTFVGKVLAIDFEKVIIENDAPMSLNKLTQISLELFGETLSLYAFPIFIQPKGNKSYAHLRLHGLSGPPLTRWNRWVQYAKMNPLVGSPAVRDPVTPTL